MGKLLELKAISHAYRDGQVTHEILDHVSFQLNQHESVALLGESGSGKSTFLQIASGLLAPVKGKVYLDHQAVYGPKLLMIRRSLVGFMFQHQYFMPQMNVIENVALPLWMMGREDAEDQAAKMLAALLVPERLYHASPHVLSGGEAARCGLARALIHKPKLLVADEPTSALDRELTQSVFQLIKAQQATLGFGLLIATHDHSVLKYVDNVYRLVQGKIKETVDV